MNKYFDDKLNTIRNSINSINESDYNTDEAYAFCVNSNTGEYEVVEMPRYYGMSIRPVMHE